tara:strand:- start:2937 stop:3347 length:411 start_codon:yes stop_codon:yes gene_type:complete
MIILLKFWKEAIIGILLLVCYFQYSHPRTLTTEVSKAVVVEKVVEKVVVKTVTKKPDGTIIIKDETTDVTKDLGSVKTVVAAAALTKYSVGISIRDLDYKDFLIEAGARLASTPFVATVGFDVKPRSFLLGLRYEF